MLPVEPLGTDDGVMTAVLDAAVVTVTVFDAEAEQPFFVTVTLYGVVAAGETVIVCVVAPVDQEYEAKPGPASSVALPPAQTEAGPLIVTTGFGFTVTVTAGDVPVHPPPFVTVTL